MGPKTRRITSLQIRAQGLNQVVGRLGLLVGRFPLGIENVKPDVPFDDFGHQGIHRAPAGGDVVEYLGALCFLIQGPFNRLHLAPDAPHPIQQFLLFSGGSAILKIYPGRYMNVP